MNCEEVNQRLPLLALGELDEMEGAAARAHLVTCERCAARFAEMQGTRGALDLVTVGEAAPLAGSTIRAAAAVTLKASTSASTALHAGPGAAIRTTFSWFSPRAAAAAALFVALGAVGFAYGSFRQLRSQSEEKNREPAIAPLALARAFAALEERVAELETRHERDLILLAQTVDRAQSSRDRGFAIQFADFEQATRKELIATRSALGDVARLVVPARFDAPIDEN